MSTNLIGIKIKQRFDNGILSSTFKSEFKFEKFFINIQQRLTQTFWIDIIYFGMSSKFTY